MVLFVMVTIIMLVITSLLVFVCCCNFIIPSAAAPRIHDAQHGDDTSRDEQQVEHISLFQAQRLRNTRKDRIIYELK
jgi:hypothetical protein